MKERNRKFWPKGSAGEGKFRRYFPAEYHSWNSAYGRCYRPSMPSYYRYGARGIEMCERWRSSPWVFYCDMGPRPAGHTLDRIDPNGNYEPGNCRWATPKQQSDNIDRSAVTTRAEVIDMIRSLRGTGSSRNVAALCGVSHVTVQKYWRECVA